MQNQYVLIDKANDLLVHSCPEEGRVAQFEELVMGGFFNSALFLTGYGWERKSQPLYLMQNEWFSVNRYGGKGG